MKKKIKKYQEGGITINQEMPAPQLSAYSAESGVKSGTDSGVNQTFNIQPSAQAGQPQGMKRGGKVKSASQRADGCAIRGKTRA
jgi:hypothetical protein